MFMKCNAKNIHYFFPRLSMILIFVVSLLAFVWPSSGLIKAAPPILAEKQPPFVALLQPKLTDVMQRLQIPGAIISLNVPGQGSWTTGMGTSILKTKAPITAESYMRVGSITKTFTATMILRLVDQGKIGLDNPVSMYQLKVPNGEQITIRELLNMTSGLFNYTEDEQFQQEALLNNPGRVWEPRELLAIAYGHQPYFAPGQGWHYSNTNYILLGLLIKQITGMPIEKVFQQEIFQPLGMVQTSLPRPTSSAIPKPHPHGYVYLTSPTTPTDATDWNPSWAWTAGAAISTAHDLTIWSKALATGQLLSTTTQKERLKWIDTGSKWIGKAGRYGLGIADFGGVIGHNGDITGFQSFMGYVPEKNATIIVLTNITNAPDGSTPADALEQVIQKELFA